MSWTFKNNFIANFGVCCLLISTLFVSLNLFVNPQSFAMYSSLMCCSFVGCGICVSSFPAYLSFMRTDLIVVLLIVCTIVVSFVEKHSYLIEYVEISSSVIFFFTIRYTKISRIAIGVTLFICLTIEYVAYKMQQIESIPIFTNDIRMIGTFDNEAGFSSFLLITLPFLWVCKEKSTRKWKLGILWTLSAIGCFILKKNRITGVMFQYDSFFLLVIIKNKKERRLLLWIKDKRIESTSKMLELILTKTMILN